MTAFVAPSHGPAATDWVWASSLADGADPISDFNRDTRPPSSSTLTASGSGPALPSMSASGPSNERQVGPAADEDPADVVTIDDGPGIVGVLYAHHQQLSQLVAGRQRRRHGRRVSTYRWCGSGHRLAHRRRRWVPCGVVAAGREHRCSGQHGHHARKSHRDMLSRRASHPRLQGSGPVTLSVDPFLTGRD